MKKHEENLAHWQITAAYESLGKTHYHPELANRFALEAIAHALIGLTHEVQVSKMKLR